MPRPFMRLGAILSLLIVPWSLQAAAAPDLPPIAAVVQKVGGALGGAQGGRAAIERAAELDFVFRRTVRDVLTGKEVVADHRYLALDGGERLRLDIRIVSGDGKDSATVVTPTAAWVIADGAKHEITSGNVRSRLAEFSPTRMFSVPFALGAEGGELLGDAAVDVVGWSGEGADRRLLLVGRDPAGEESARLELDAVTYRPARVSFISTGGQVLYRYGDYREVAPGLVVPFERELQRNGQRVSSLRVQHLSLKADVSPGLFDAATTTLPAIPTAR